MSLLVESAPDQTGAIVVSRFGDILQTSSKRASLLGAMVEVVDSLLWAESTVACLVVFRGPARAFAYRQAFTKLSTPAKVVSA